MESNEITNFIVIAYRITINKKTKLWSKGANPHSQFSLHPYEEIKVIQEGETYPHSQFSLHFSQMDSADTQVQK